MLFSVDTTVRGRFSEKRCGPSRRCARNASAALENFVCCPQKTFSTASVKLRRTLYEQMSSGLPLKADIARCSRHVSKVPGAAVPIVSGHPQKDRDIFRGQPRKPAL